MNEPNHDLSKAASDMQDSTALVRSALATIRWMMVVLFVVVVGLSIAVLRYNHAAEVRADRLDAKVQKVVDAANDLQTTTPEEQTRNAAISRAVAQVPQIKSILCDPSAFPDAAACKEP